MVCWIMCKLYEAIKYLKGCGMQETHSDVLICLRKM